MQTMLAGNNWVCFEGRVNLHLSEGWVVVPGTSASGPLGLSIVVEKSEEPDDPEDARS